MRSWDKEVEQSLLYDEKAVIKSLEKNYQSALKEVDDRIGSFAARISSGDNVQSAIYQMRYQQELKKQIEKSLENLQNNNYSTITDYLQSTYKNGFMGAQYTLHKQGIPLITPINQQSIVQALTLNSKINTGLYNRLGVDVEQFKHIITTEVSRGIATGSSWNQIAKQISNKGNVTFSNASRIARTEGHRIQSEAKIDAYTSAKTKGADIVKQWDSTLDGKTRDTHRKLDGQIRELDEDFEVNGMTVSAPGHFGDPAEDCNCRCCLLQRARWALDAEELKTLQDRAEYFGLDKSKDFEDFKEKYLNAVENSDDNDIIEIENGLFKKDGSDPMFDAFGSAESSNPEELEKLLKDLSNMGIEINTNSGGALAYQSTQFGKPGVISVTPNASYAAYLHEAQHAKDDMEAGWNGSRAVWDADEHIRREQNAYAVEIKLAEDLGRPDIADELRTNLENEIDEIKKRDEKYAKLFNDN